MSRRQYFDARYERERQQRWTITDPAGYLARLIAEIDRDAARIDDPAKGRYDGDHSIAELGRLRALALTALWRLPLGGEQIEYPTSDARSRTPGERSLSHAIQFWQAIRPWDQTDWRGDHAGSERARGELHRTVKSPWRGGRGGEVRYAYSVEDVVRRARLASRIAIKWGLLEEGRFRAHG